MENEKEYRIHDFGKTEIFELRNYIEKHVPFHVLNGMYILTDKIEDKASIFTGIYRILKSCSNYTNEETAKKLKYFLNKCEDAEKEIYQLFIEIKSNDLNYGKNLKLKKLKKLIINYKKEIEELTDLFIVLGSNIELMKTDAILGVDEDKSDRAKGLIEEARKIAKKEGA